MEGVVTYFKSLPGTRLEECGGKGETARIFSVPAQIRTMKFPNTNQMRYSLTGSIVPTEISNAESKLAETPQIICSHTKGTCDLRAL